MSRSPLHDREARFDPVLIGKHQRRLLVLVASC